MVLIFLVILTIIGVSFYAGRTQKEGSKLDDWSYFFPEIPEEYKIDGSKTFEEFKIGVYIKEMTDTEFLPHVTN